LKDRKNEEKKQKGKREEETRKEGKWECSKKI
jgi:hypothetical protein